MKSILFLFGFLVACTGCEPSKVDFEKGNIDSGHENTEQLQPVGVIPADDCQQIDIGDKACNFRLLDQNGDVWDLYSHAGAVIVLDFSAVWCYPCQLAGAHAQPLQDEFEGENVEIVTILIDGPAAGEPPTKQDVDTWVNSHGITTAPILEGSRAKMIDPQDGTVAEPGVTGYLLNAYPTYVYIGRDMKFYAGHVGFSEEYMRQKIQEGL